MGPKITVDSATLMNKGLEVIEAHYLFGVPYERISVLLNPQSVVHSMVRFGDGAVLAHLGVPDMRVPIAYALGYPHVRPTLPMVRRLDFFAGDLTFAKPAVERFRCLALAIEAGKKAAIVETEAGCASGVCFEAPTSARSAGRAASPRPPTAPRTVAAPIVLNAANEVAVHAFLQGRLAFAAIPEVVEKCLTWLGDEPVESLDDVFACDAEARRFAREAARQPS
jgi:1-deoxy-D-xylulose-5-phosphate reductoisomerase